MFSLTSGLSARVVVVCKVGLSLMFVPGLGGVVIPFIPFAHLGRPLATSSKSFKAIAQHYNNSIDIIILLLW